MGEGREECSRHGEESVQRPSDKKGADLEGGKERRQRGEGEGRVSSKGVRPRFALFCRG